MRCRTPPPRCCSALATRAMRPAISWVHWNDDAPRPRLYMKSHGLGTVLYPTLGHACGRFHMLPIVEETTPLIGPWAEPT